MPAIVLLGWWMCYVGALFSSPSRLIPSVVLLLVSGRLWLSIARQRMMRCWDEYMFDPVCVPSAGWREKRLQSVAYTQLPEVSENAV